MRVSFSRFGMLAGEMPDNDACGGGSESLIVSFVGDRRGERDAFVDGYRHVVSQGVVSFIDGSVGGGFDGPDDGGDFGSYDNGPCFMG